MVRAGSGQSGPVLEQIDLVISLDLDGTVWFGDPAGPISRDLVKAITERGIPFGSASDRTVLDQRRLWESVGFVPDFVVVKNHLRRIPDSYPTRILIHIGDRLADAVEAANARAAFVHVDSVLPEQWLDREEMWSILESRGRAHRGAVNSP